MKYAHIILCDGMIKKFKILKKIYVILFLLLILVFLILFYMINSKSSSLIIDYANFNARKLAVEVLRNTGLKEDNEVVKNEDQKFIIPNEYKSIFSQIHPNQKIEEFNFYFLTKMPNN